MAPLPKKPPQQKLPDALTFSVKQQGGFDIFTPIQYWRKCNLRHNHFASRIIIGHGRPYRLGRPLSICKYGDGPNSLTPTPLKQLLQEFSGHSSFPHFRFENRRSRLRVFCPRFFGYVTAAFLRCGQTVRFKTDSAQTHLLGNVGMGFSPSGRLRILTPPSLPAPYPLAASHLTYLPHFSHLTSLHLPFPPHPSHPSRQTHPSHPTKYLIFLILIRFSPITETHK